MKPLIAIVTCHKYHHRADACRRSWVRDVTGSAVKFFVGLEPEDDGAAVLMADDTVMLPVYDGYTGLVEKVKAMLAWALAEGYTHIIKCDDDAYVVPSRLFSTINFNCDYVGNFRAPNGKYPASYASGFCYMLSARAAQIIVDAPLTDDTMEDRYVGNTLTKWNWDNEKNGLNENPLDFSDEKRFICTYPGVEYPEVLWRSPVGKTHAVYAQYPESIMPKLHHWYHVFFRGAQA